MALGTDPRVIATATCRFADGETRVVYATWMSANAGFFLTLRPPPISADVHLTLRPLGGAALPPLAARVIGARLDPGDVRLSGFEAMFRNVDPAVESALAALAGGEPVGYVPLSSHGHAGSERRLHPRASTDLRGLVQMAGATFEARVLNLSLGGALLRLQGTELPAALALGAALRLYIHTDGSSAPIVVAGHVIAVRRDAGPPSIGAHFDNPDHRTVGQLERAIIDAVVPNVFPPTTED
jgi:hypothetical protein